MRQRYYPATLLFAFLFLCLQLYTFAQDTTISTTSTTATSSTESVWYMQPWAWIAGGIALLLILVALFSGGSKKNKPVSRTDKVIITKTVRTETDVDD